MVNKKALASLVLAAAVSMSGCSTKENASSPAGDTGKSDAVRNNTPFTLLFYTAQNGNYATEDNFSKEIGNFITSKFPHIKVEHIHKGKGQDYPDLIAAGTIPDIILESSTNVKPRIIANDLNYDMSELIKKHNFDLNRLDPTVVQVLKNWGDGKLYGLPFMGSNLILGYNKDIFDKFGVPYPKDGVTWDEVYDIVRKVSRADNGVNYVGLRYNSPLVFKYNQRSLGFMSEKEDKAAVNTDAWKDLFANFKRIYDVPNNEISIPGEFAGGTEAMDLNVTEKLITWSQKNPTTNWDIIAAPVFKDAPKVGFQPNFYSMYVTKQSKHKDEAFDVIAYLLSDEVQTQLSKQALLTPLSDKKIQSVFGQEIESLKGKNLQAVFYNRYAAPAPIRDASLTFADVAGVPGNTFDKMLKNNSDINSALREAEETINKALTDAKAQGGGAK